MLRIVAIVEIILKLCNATFIIEKDGKKQNTCIVEKLNRKVRDKVGLSLIPLKNSLVNDYRKNDAIW